SGGALLYFRSLRPNPLFLRSKLRSKLFAEIFGFEHLPDLDLAIFVVWIRTALHPFDGLFFDFTFQSQKPAITSFVSVNGPSTTVRLFPENLTRAPFD